MGLGFRVSVRVVDGCWVKVVGLGSGLGLGIWLGLGVRIVGLRLGLGLVVQLGLGRVRDKGLTPSGVFIRVILTFKVQWV